MARHSKLQLQVLQLYKTFLRVAENKPGVKAQIQYEFRKGAKMPRTDLMRIEYVVRRAERQLKMLQTGSVDRAGTFTNENEDTSSGIVGDSKSNSGRSRTDSDR
nr:succinate dehydrogenase assembly factor 1, mitochondrial-like [Lytechinus pictus]